MCEWEWVGVFRVNLSYLVRGKGRESGSSSNTFECWSVYINKAWIKIATSLKYSNMKNQDLEASDLVAQ